jgi:hypothetical protein
MMALSVGMRCLNFRNRWLDYGRETVLPFYFLHQPVIVVVAFFAVQWGVAAELGTSIDIVLKWLVIVICSFALTIGLYHALVRQVPAVQLLLGGKQ